MNSPQVTSLVVLIGSFLVSVVITSLFRLVALRHNLLDHPNQAHKSHLVAIPYLGGVAIVSTSLVFLLSLALLGSSHVVLSDELFFLLASPLVLALVGLIDDLKNLHALPKLLLQSIGAFLVAGSFLQYNLLNPAISFGFFTIPLVVIWIVTITNATNFIDNLDGGAGGVVFLCSISFTIVTLSSGQFAVSTLASIIAGATLGFLIWNINPARIYLGDSGSLFLGSMLAILSLRIEASMESRLTTLIFLFGSLAIPILDISVAVISRLARRASPFSGGLDHLSHRLISKGLSVKSSAIIIWSLQSYFCAISILLFNARGVYEFVFAFAIVASLALSFSFFYHLRPLR